MATIIIHPETEAKEKAIKEILEISFEQSEELYPKHVLAGLEEGIRQSKNGETKTYAEVKDLLASRWS